MTDQTAYPNAGKLPKHYSAAKLTAAQRDEIVERYAKGETASSLALEFNVSAALIRTVASPR